MKLHSFIIIALLSFGNLHAAENSKVEPFSNSEKLINQEDCFIDEHSDYESWIKSLAINNKKFNVEKFKEFASEEEFNRYKNNLECYSFVYSVDGIRVKGYAIKPKVENFIMQKPVIIYNRGGNNVNSHTLNFLTLFNYVMPIAEKGYIVISTQYRGAEVWPKNTKFNVGQDEFGGRDIEDVLGLYPLIKGMSDADISKIGMFGWSRGGMMTYLALTRATWIKAAVVGGAPTDLVKQSEDRPEMDKHVFKRLIPNYAQNKRQELEKRSVIYWAKTLPKNVPILIIHGDADKSVPSSDATK